MAFGGCGDEELLVVAGSQVLELALEGQIGPLPNHPLADSALLASGCVPGPEGNLMRLVTGQDRSSGRSILVDIEGSTAQVEAVAAFIDFNELRFIRFDVSGYTVARGQIRRSLGPGAVEVFDMAPSFGFPSSLLVGHFDDRESLSMLAATPLLQNDTSAVTLFTSDIDDNAERIQGVLGSSNISAIRLSRIDFNQDGIDDYLVSTAAGAQVQLMGPVTE